MHRHRLIEALVLVLVFKNIFGQYHKSVKQFGSRSGPAFHQTLSGQTCLHNLSADNTNRLSVRLKYVLIEIAKCAYEMRHA